MGLMQDERLLWEGTDVDRLHDKRVVEQDRDTREEDWSKWSDCLGLESAGQLNCTDMIVAGLILWWDLFAVMTDLILYV